MIPHLAELHAVSVLIWETALAGMSEPRALSAKEWKQIGLVLKGAL
jgi:hypothetical protein